MSLITVFVSSVETYSERRFPLHLTLDELQTKLYSITGIPPSNQILKIHSATDPVGRWLAGRDDQIQDSTGGTQTLANLHIENGSTLDVADKDPTSAGKVGQYNDLSRADKYEMSNDEYAKRSDSLLAFKQRHQLGRFAKEQTNPLLHSSSSPETKPLSLLTRDGGNVITVDDVGKRCQVLPMSGDVNAASRATIRYVGALHSTGSPAASTASRTASEATTMTTSRPSVPTGTWVGVEYDEPVGRNDGSVQENRYFTCLPHHGAFVKPERVQIGDFPPIDPFQDDLDEM